LSQALPQRHADLEYLRLLKLAKETLESTTETAIASLLKRGEPPMLDAVRRSETTEALSAPILDIVPIDLEPYDRLIESATRGEDGCEPLTKEAAL
jgi:hypothetical protein